MRCPYCWTFDSSWEWGQQWQDCAFLDSEKWAEAFNKHPEITEIDLAGGEPFLQPEIDKFINNVKQPVFITSNIKDVDYFIENVNPKRVPSITCSLHLANKNFDENLLKLRDAGFNVRVNYVAWPKQVDVIPDLIRKYVGWGIEIHIEPYFEGKKIYDYQGEIATMMRKYTPHDRMKNVTEKEINYKCSAGSDSIIILPNGAVYPCTLLAWENRYKLGNIFEDKAPYMNGPIEHTTNFCMGCDYDKVYREVMK